MFLRKLRRWVDVNPGIFAALLLCCALAQPLAAQPAAETPQEEFTPQDHEAFPADAKRLWSEAQRQDREGKLDEAIAAGEQGLAALRSSRGDAHAAVVTALGWLANRYERQEKFAQAQKTRGEIYSLQKRLNGPGHWKVKNAQVALECLNRRAALSPQQRKQLTVAGEKNREVLRLIREAKYAEATIAAQESAGLLKSILGPLHSDYASTLSMLGSVWFAAGDYAKAEPPLREALEIKRKCFGAEHPEAATSMVRLASLFLKLGDFTKAEPLFRQALEINKNSLGEEHSLTVTNMNNLGNLLAAMRKYELAEPLLKQSLQIKQKLIGTDGYETAIALNNLGQIYLSLRKFDQAEPLLRQAVELAEKSRGAQHPSTATALANLGSL